MSGPHTNPIVPPRGHSPAVRAVPAEDRGNRPDRELSGTGSAGSHRDGPPQGACAARSPDVGLRVLCGVVAAFAAVMFATLVVLGLKEADRAIRRANVARPVVSAASAEIALT